jgi:hypothetical protein
MNGFNGILYHATKKPFSLPFDENKIGLGNDLGYSGRGFYFFNSIDEAKYAAPNGYVREFEVKINNIYTLTNTNDPFSIETDESEESLRDQVTLKLLKNGYDGTVRYLNGKIDEICVLSFNQYNFDGNKHIKEIPNSKWKKIS